MDGFAALFKKIQVQYPYTLSTADNLRCVFGPNLALLPLSTVSGNGIDYPVNNNQGNDQKSNIGNITICINFLCWEIEFNSWPPEEYYANHNSTNENRGECCIQKIIFSDRERVVVSIVDEDGETVIKSFTTPEFRLFIDNIRNGQYWLSVHAVELGLSLN
ncbi:hypothetical protein AYI68_g6778 [Smittium mucronatum]|uniref:Uncharacterized protein n=1 Tax=Smittium mucronatum TaxID=133383 RepID=A0A1R0GQI4_9FUNG|nr:hypothetical protein AYI68_g6778 [Smittium mucronatum]